MPDRPYNLAIETAARRGSIALGRDDELLEAAPLHATHRHSVGLMPGIASLCARHGVEPARIGQLYLGHGPGSFTGLRVALAAAKMLALVHAVKLVAVPSIRVLADNAPPDAEHLAVCVNQKRWSVYAGLFTRQGDRWQPADEPAVRDYAELLASAPRPLLVLGEPLPELDPDQARTLHQNVRVLPAELTQPRAEAVWHHGRALAEAGRFADPLTLEPLYAREPEAVTLWNQRHASPASSP